MPFRKYAAIPHDPHFREALRSWARKFVLSDTAANRVVQRTINVLCNDPSLLDGPDINAAVFALLRRHAFDENEWTAVNISQHDALGVTRNEVVL